MREQERQRSSDSPLLTSDDQAAVLALATRLQRENDDGVRLSELIDAGKEAGLSQEAVEEAYRVILQQAAGRQAAEGANRAKGNVTAALQLTIIWMVISWILTWLDASNNSFVVFGVAAIFLAVPIGIAFLSRRVWLAVTLASVGALNLLLSTVVRFGTTNLANLSFALPFLIPILVSGLAALAFELRDRQKAE